jgi:oligogalacturonide lyase
MLCVARKSMRLYFMQSASTDTAEQRRGGGPLRVMEVDLQKVFEDSKNGKMKPASTYQRICGIIGAELGAGGDMALDADEDLVDFENRCCQTFAC